MGQSRRPAQRRAAAIRPQRACRARLPHRAFPAYLYVARSDVQTPYQADKQFTEGDPEHSATCGATASVALLQPLDLPAAPFFSAQRIALTVAHVGDTRVLLCATDGGRVEPLTETHHAETRGESARLRRMGTSRVMDSFGESRWMGALANTRWCVISPRTYIVPAC